ncbi:4'-phosphopantetheinyl transferase family protein [Aquirufa aurantiipilula]|uniref:4'-phosphopantetheinyl transferase superfamily protein n=1 Tax=Aquirufa aurantiipilula TaxID=2696561 RepID=A0ABT6BLI4_9BACT|nr:4'-phosphopantetheinyl transferase superfamily protein [Aquirufa aurantiipilula]MBZ1326963.1 4'-phosphopantetheinyl transferase superfamily protein [Aquirufa aurantiipilula]MDF5691203.1 4'-phosphopantetheinyl transferase superfamily protein [Aquirufa aurantiipilula]
MPQIFPLRDLNLPGTSWMIWEIRENEAFFEDIPNSWKSTLPPNHALDIKKLESLAARFCLWQLVQSQVGQELILDKTSNNRPYFQNSDWQISISHSFPYVAAAICYQQNIGLDLEKKARNIQKVAPRFLSASEMEWSKMDEIKLLAAWTSKEAIYKAQHQAGLDFRKSIQLDCLFPIQKACVQFDQESNDFELWHEEFPEFWISLAKRI